MIIMEKCRICCKSSKKYYSLQDREEGITFFDMITSTFSILKIFGENITSDKICLSCCRKIREAYYLKIDIEKSEMFTNKTENFKRISFNNINDIKIRIKIDYKPAEHHQKSLEELIKNNSQILLYNNTAIKKITEECSNNQKTHLTVEEFLNSVKMKSDDDSDIDYNHVKDNQTSSESDYEDVIKLKKQMNKFCTSKSRKSKNIKKQRNYFIKTPIKPICLKDVIIQHSDKKVEDSKQLKKKYKYPAKRSICPYCGKLFMSSYLSIHILHHTTEKLYKCDKCPKLFHTQDLLNKHVKIHTNINKFKCNQCIATFNSKVSYNGHMIVHSDEKKYLCNICNKSFKRLSALKRHRLIHNFGKKAIQCELCPMTFHDKYFLNHHMRVHTGERPYKCEICSQPYSYKHDFNRHCLKKHGVFLKRRSVKIMNEEVLQQERALIRDLTLQAKGVIKDVPSVYEGPHGALAFAQAIKALEAKQIPVNYTDSNSRL